MMVASCAVRALDCFTEEKGEMFWQTRAWTIYGGCFFTFCYGPVKSSGHGVACLFVRARAKTLSLDFL